jgi:hypothetical protein
MGDVGLMRTAQKTTGKQQGERKTWGRSTGGKKEVGLIDGGLICGCRDAARRETVFVVEGQFGVGVDGAMEEGVPIRAFQRRKIHILLTRSWLPLLTAPKARL